MLELNDTGPLAMDQYRELTHAKHAVRIGACLEHLLALDRTVFSEFLQWVPDEALKDFLLRYNHNEQIDPEGRTYGVITEELKRRSHG